MPKQVVNTQLLLRLVGHHKVEECAAKSAPSKEAWDNVLWDYNEESDSPLTRNQLKNGWKNLKRPGRTTHSKAVRRQQRMMSVLTQGTIDDSGLDMDGPASVS